MKPGAWNGQPVKRGNWGTWAQIETPHTAVNQSCYTCIHADDGACTLHGAVIAEIGKDYYRLCKDYVPDDFLIDGKQPRKRSRQVVKAINVARSETDIADRKRCAFKRKKECKLYFALCVNVTDCQVIAAKNTRKPEKPDRNLKIGKENQQMNVLTIARTLREEYPDQVKKIVELYDGLESAYAEIEDAILGKFGQIVKTDGMQAGIDYITGYSAFMDKIKAIKADCEMCKGDLMV